MPKNGGEIYLTDIETDLMSVFVQKKIFKDLDIAAILIKLAMKLEGHYNEKNID